MNFAISLVSNFEGWLTFLYEFDNYLNYFVLFALLFFGIMSWYYFIYFFLSLMPLEKFPKGEKLFKYAVLVPARNEDKVIVNLLKSLKEQDYNPDYFDVYVIVESKDDPTIQITKSFGYNVIIRKDLINKRTKGYALNEAYQYLKANNLKYDSLVIFDADNIVNKDFLSLMNDCKNKGYQVTVGYRNFTNASTNWISGCSGTLFSYMNQFTSNGRSFFFKKATLTGTGYYIDMDIVDNEGGWIWTGMTEDVELTCYCYYHNISMHYYNYAQYYDEQATSYKVLHKQHIRWVWGYFDSKKRFKNKKENYYDALPKWKYLKGGKQEIRKSANGYEYKYSEGSMAFPDALDKPSRTIITGEGGSGPSRFKHVIQTESGRYRRLTPVELERLNMFPDQHTEGVSDSRRAFLMGNALVTGIVEKIGIVLLHNIDTMK